MGRGEVGAGLIHLILFFFLKARGVKKILITHM